jgi:cell division protein YceG involved in septum cleavage
MRRLLVLVIVGVVVTAAAFGIYVRQELRVLGTPAEGLIIEIPRGLGAREIVGLLKEKKVIQSPTVAFAYILYTGARHKLRAGE